MRGDVVEAALWMRALALVCSHNIESDADTGPLFENPAPDSDPEVLKRLRQMYEAGGWVLVESAIADLPADLRWLFESGAVTIEQLGAIHHDLGVTSAADMAAAVREQRLRALPGLNAEVEAAVGAALPALRARIPRIPLGRAVGIAEMMLAPLRDVPGVRWTMPVGSLRRGQDMVGDIEILAPTDEPAAAVEALLSLAAAAHVLHRGERRVYVLTDRQQIGILLPEPANAGAELLYLTGSRAHFEALQAHAATRGLTLKADGLYAADGTRTPAAAESDIYASLGLPFIPPEIRNGDEEIALASRGALPTLVSRDDIRGDLHMHSTWSDGRDSIAVMVEEAG